MKHQKSAFPYLMLLVLLLIGLPILDYQIEGDLGIEIQVKTECAEYNIDVSENRDNDKLITHSIDPAMIPN
ncbi:MAG: hypothetical protein P1U56_09990 [Saprospiraceae bacterium]|nr:hypothetical protein [Saprospiraceae bacterium]